MIFARFQVCIPAMIEISAKREIIIRSYSALLLSTEVLCFVINSLHSFEVLINFAVLINIHLMLVKAVLRWLSICVRVYAYVHVSLKKQHMLG